MTDTVWRILEIVAVAAIALFLLALFFGPIIGIYR